MDDDDDLFDLSKKSDVKSSKSKSKIGKKGAKSGVKDSKKDKSEKDKERKKSKGDVDKDRKKSKVGDKDRKKSKVGDKDRKKSKPDLDKDKDREKEKEKEKRDRDRQKEKERQKAKESSKPASKPASRPASKPPSRPPTSGKGQIMIQEIDSYNAYLGIVDSLEKGDGKVRTVFLFIQPGDNSMKNVIKQAEKEHGATGILVICRPSVKEWPRFQSDRKFKPNSLPWAGVFNRKLTLGRHWIHKTLYGDQIYDPRRFAFLFK